MSGKKPKKPKKVWQVKNLSVKCLEAKTIKTGTIHSSLPISAQQGVLFGTSSTACPTPTNLLRAFSEVSGQYSLTIDTSSSPPITKTQILTFFNINNFHVIKFQFGAITLQPPVTTFTATTTDTCVLTTTDVLPVVGTVGAIHALALSGSSVITIVGQIFSDGTITFIATYSNQITFSDVDGVFYLFWYGPAQIFS